MTAINPTVQRIQEIAHDPAAAGNKYKQITHDKSQYLTNFIVGLGAGLISAVHIKEESKLPSLLFASLVVVVSLQSYNSWVKTNQDRAEQQGQIISDFDPSIACLKAERIAKGKAHKDNLDGTPEPADLEKLIKEFTESYDGPQGADCGRVMDNNSYQALMQSAKNLKDFDTTTLEDDINPLAKEKITMLGTRARFFLNGANPGGTYVNWEMKDSKALIQLLD